jgi:hypothetical protein
MQSLRPRAFVPVTRLFTVAVLANFAWEMAGMHLYEPSGSWLQESVACGRASVGDRGIVLLIYAAEVVLFRRSDWFRRPRASAYAVMVIAGIILAVAFEMSALRSGRWAYTASMPLIPTFDQLGLLPIAQWRSSQPSCSGSFQRSRTALIPISDFRPVGVLNRATVDGLSGGAATEALALRHQRQLLQRSRPRRVHLTQADPDVVSLAVGSLEPVADGCYCQARGSSSSDTATCSACSEPRKAGTLSVA